jgi:SSS family solute:Na+ symporter
MAAVIAMAIYFAALVVISWYARHAARSQAFVLGERQVGLLGTMASQAVGSMDGSGLVIMVMFGIILGFGAAWLIPGVVIGFGLLAWQGPRIRELACKHNILNINDFLGVRIGPGTEKLSILITLATSWLATAGQLYVTGLIFHAATGWPQWVGVVLGGGVVMLYTIIGGYVTLVRTDMFQWLAATAVFSGALIFGSKPSAALAWQQFCVATPDWKWGLVLLPAFVYYATPDTWQRIFSARDAHVARFGPAWVIPVHAIYLLACVTLGFTISAAVGNHDPINAFYRYLSSPAVPGWIGAAMGVLAMAMVMSTLDTRAYVFISMVSKNILKIDPEENLHRYVDTTRTVTLVYFVVSIVVAIFISNIVQFMLNTVTVFAILGPVLCVAVYSDSSRRRYLDATMCGVILFGVAVFFVMLAAGQLTTVLLTVVPIIAATIATALAFFCLPRQAAPAAERYHALQPDPSPPLLKSRAR